MEKEKMQTNNLPQKYGHTVLQGMPFTHHFGDINITIIFSYLDYSIPFHCLAGKIIEDKHKAYNHDKKETTSLCW